MKTFACILVVMIAAPPLAFGAAAENALEQARRHYEAAAYEEALAALSKADRSTRSQIIEVEQYRAFCFIALGRAAEAESAIAALVEADPLYIPSASPRVQSVVSDIRRKVLPGVARRLLTTGRTAFTQRQHDRALEIFQLLLRVLADPTMQGRAEASDMRVLAESFVALVAASPAPTPMTEAPAVAQIPSPAPRLPPPSPPVLVPAVAINEELPPWMPDRLSARFEFEGSLRLTIGRDGRVKEVNIEDPSHPAYDARLVQATRSWLYKPALRDGEPIEFEKVLEIRLRPPTGS